MEVLNQLIIANLLNYVDDSNLNEYRKEIGIISRQLNALKKSQLRRQHAK
jgi:hypothetical protein